jgi:hypothetical protein
VLKRRLPWIIINSSLEIHPEDKKFHHWCAEDIPEEGMSKQSTREEPAS